MEEFYSERVGKKTRRKLKRRARVYKAGGKHRTRGTRKIAG